MVGVEGLEPINHSFMRRGPSPIRRHTHYLWQRAEVSIPTPLLAVPTVFKTGPEAALDNSP